MTTNVYFTADHHMGHPAILRYTKRQWTSVEAMNEALVLAWNNVVQPEDTVYHLGDVSFARQGTTLALLAQLHGTKHLITGNHDRKMPPDVRARFASVQPYLEATINGQFVVMCHYPFMTWNRAHHGSWSLHGHSHGSLRATTGRRMDVGVDCHPDYAPFSWAEVERHMAAREFAATDHHVEKEDRSEQT